MNIRKPHFAPPAIAAFTVALALILPCAAGAVSIGEVVLHSGRGAPLLARVYLVVESNERIGDACLSLAAPDPLQQDADSFLTEAILSFKNDGKRQYVDIKSLQPFNGELARLRLQIKCPGMRGAIKTLIIAPPVQMADKEAGRPASVTTGSSGVPTGKPQIEKIGEAAPTLPPEQQKQHNSAAPELLSAANAQEKNAKPGSAANQPVMQEDSTNVQNTLVAILWLVLSILALWLGLRHNAAGIKAQRGTGTATEQADEITANIFQSEHESARR